MFLLGTFLEGPEFCYDVDLVRLVTFYKTGNRIILRRILVTIFAVERQ